MSITAASDDSHALDDAIGNEAIPDPVPGAVAAIAMIA